LTHARFIRAEHVTELNDAVRAFLASPLLAEYYPQSVNKLNKIPQNVALPRQGN